MKQKLARRGRGGGHARFSNAVAAQRRKRDNSEKRKIARVVKTAAKTVRATKKRRTA